MGALVSYRNWIDGSDVSFSSNHAVDTGFSYQQLRTRQLLDRCRFNHAGSALQITVDFGVERVVRMVAMLGCNAPFNTSFTIYRSTNGSTWSSVGSNVIADLMQPRVGPGNGIIPLDSNLAFRYWQFRTNWSPPAGEKVEIGRLWLGDAMDIVAGVDGQWTLGVDDTGVITETESMQAFADPGAVRRRFKGRVSLLRELQAFGFDPADGMADDVPSFQGLQMCGTTASVIVLPRAGTFALGTANILWNRRLGIYGRMSRTIDINHMADGYYEVPDIEVLEELG